MDFDLETLQQEYEEAAGGKTPEEYLKLLSKMLLELWDSPDQKYRKYYRYAGPYWEILHDILEKNAPEQLKEFERAEGPFTYFNEDVKKEYTTGKEHYDLFLAINYIKYRMQFHLVEQVHIVEVGDNLDYPVMPNQSLDLDGVY